MGDGNCMGDSIYIAGDKCNDGDGDGDGVAPS